MFSVWLDTLIYSCLISALLPRLKAIFWMTVVAIPSNAATGAE